MKKSFFGINFDPSSQPGHQTRNVSFDGLVGQKLKSEHPKLEDGNFGPKKKVEDARQKYGTMQVKELLPSVILRKKGRV